MSVAKADMSVANAMEPGKSLLNPYADSFVPLYEEPEGDKNQPSKTSQDSENAEKDPVVNSQNINKTPEYNTMCYLDIPELDGLSLEDLMAQTPPSEYMDEDEDGEVECDLACLAANFPDVSQQSLADVYFTCCRGDLEASMQLMNELESKDLGDDQNVPDTSSSPPSPSSSSCNEANSSA